jgi:hypothetical protein
MSKEAWKKDKKKDRGTHFQRLSIDKIVVGHTGQSSQLFTDATGRNAQFLATVARSGLVRQVESTLGLRITRDA